MEIRLDSLDRKLLYELDHNSRQPLSELAKRLKQGRDRIGYRVDRLVDIGVIRGFTTTLNSYKLGFTVFKNYLRVENEKARVRALIAHLERHPRVYWIAECSGRWDLIFSLFAESAHEFHVLQDEILSRFNDLIMSFDVFTLVNLWMHRKSYFLGGPRRAGHQSLRVGGAPERHELDAIEIALLQELSKNARMSVTELADRTGATPIMVRGRIERLERIGVISGYRIDVDMKKLGMTFFKTLLYLRDYSRKQEEAFREACARHPNITYYIHQLGPSKLELELEVKDYLEYHSVIDALTQQFSGLIRNVETNLILREQYRWLPGDLKAG